MPESPRVKGLGPISFISISHILLKGGGCRASVIDSRMEIQIETFGGPPLHIRPSPPCPEQDVSTPIAMDNSVSAQIQVAEVKFFPPLHEQRRSWALEILRRERVTSVGPFDDDEIASGSQLIVSPSPHNRSWTWAVGRVSSSSISRTPRRGVPIPPLRLRRLCSKSRTLSTFGNFTVSTFTRGIFCMRST